MLINEFIRRNRYGGYGTADSWHGKQVRCCGLSPGTSV
jgi:hypothetical protein